MKGANRQMRMLVMIFQKKICLGKWTVIILDPLYEFLKILHIEKGQQVDESNNNGLYQRFFFSRQMGYFGPENGAYPHNSESALRFLTKILQNERGSQVHENFISYFSKKKLFGAISSFQPLGHFLLFDWGWSN